MKKILIPVMAVAMSLFIYSCDKTTEEIFDRSATERTSAAVAEAQQVLMGAGNGWLVEYYPERNQQYGGFNLYFKFGSQSTVEVRSELEPAAAVESIYQMLEDRGPTVNFTSYNRLLHYFSDPSLTVGGGKGLAYEGDYEFVVEKATSEEVILIGKKTQGIIRLTPFTGSSWTDYCQSMIDSRVNNIFPLSMTVEGEELLISKAYKRYTITTAAAEDIEIGFINTPTGIKFYKPITLHGKTMQYFDIINDKLVCTDEGINAEITYAYIEYESFLGTYTMEYATSNAVSMNRNRTATVTVTENVPGESYYLKGILTSGDEAQGNIVLKFTGGGVELAGQVLFTRSGTPVKDFWFLPYSTPTNGNYTTRSTTVGMVSSDFIFEGMSVKGFTMIDNKIWGNYVCSGFILRNYDTGTGNNPVNVNGKDGQAYYYYPKFTKQ